jgi:lysozyme
MRTSEKGRAFISQAEGVRLHVYDDSAGLPTIGVGHLLTRDELDSGLILAGSESVPWNDGITKEQADAILARDLRRTENGVNGAVQGTLLDQHQFDALVSLAFNIGVGAFAGSTLCRLVVAGKFQEAADQFQYWRKAGGKVTPGLVSRRAREADLFRGLL